MPRRDTTLDEDDDNYESEDDRRDREETERENEAMENDPFSDDEKEQMGDNDHPWVPN